MSSPLPIATAAPPLPPLDPQVIDALSLERFRPYVTDIYTEFFWHPPGAEHYKLLAYLSTCWDDATLIDLGTDKGCSALALSHNPANRVVSYDIEDRKLTTFDLPNIEFRIGDALADIDELLAAPLIVLDTAHDGTFERAVYERLSTEGYAGLLLCDDIYLNAPMRQFWLDAAHEKHDLTAIGHWSGTGLIRFPG